MAILTFTFSVINNKRELYFEHTLSISGDHKNMVFLEQGNIMSFFPYEINVVFTIRITQRIKKKGILVDIISSFFAFM